MPSAEIGNVPVLAVRLEGRKRRLGRRQTMEVPSRQLRGAEQGKSVRHELGRRDEAMMIGQAPASRTPGTEQPHDAIGSARARQPALLERQHTNECALDLDQYDLDCVAGGRKTLGEFGREKWTNQSRIRRLQRAPARKLWAS